MELEITQDQVTTITGILSGLPTATNSVTFTQDQADAIAAINAIVQANIEPALPASDATPES